MNNENILSKDARAQRRADIDSDYAAGNLTAEQRDELHGIENNTTSWIKARYAALAVLCLTIGGILLMS